MDMRVMLNSERGKTVMAYSRTPGNHNPPRCWKKTRMSLLNMLVIFVCTSLLVPGCADKKEVSKTEKIINVKVWTIEKRPIRPYIEAVGSLEPD